MKKATSYIIFAIIAVALIWAGVWYDNQSTAQSNAVAQQQGQTAINAEQQLMSQLTITDPVVGTGTVAQAGDTVSVLYTGTLDNGTVFDASSLHGNVPFSFTIGATGAGSVIEGWNLGLVGMKVGGTRDLTIPPDLGYGDQANGPIPASSTLHFKIQLLSVSSTTQ